MGVSDRDRPYGPERFRLDGAVALVTGAGGAFGRVTAIALARAGAAVMATDIDAVRAAETAALVTAEGGRAASAPVDSADPASVDAAFAALDAAFGRIDILVNNAGINPMQGRPEDFPLDVWDRVLATNLTGYLHHAQRAARRMIAQGAGGAIVNVASIAGASVLGRGNLAYGVSKAGVLQMTRELAVDWAQHAIRVNAILPAQFINDGWRRAIDDPARRPLVERVLSGIPIGRMGDPDEIAGPILFLVSPAASMVTGAALPVDGGNLALNAGGSHAGLGMKEMIL